MIYEKNIVNYLNSFVNRNENLSNLLNLYLDFFNTDEASIFIHDNISKKYNLIIHKNKENKETNIKFEPKYSLTNIVISEEDNMGYICSSIVNNILIIPIIIISELIGAICIVNFKKKYTEEILEDISSYISLTQIILKNHKLLIESKRLYSDSTYFSKDLFLANMSHEIRTPLNGIIGYNQLLMQTNLNTTQKAYLTSMNQCSIQLMQIINDILDFSKLSSGKMMMNSECFQLKEVVEIVKDAMGQRIKEKKQKIIFNISEENNIFLILDKQKYVQIIINLVSNANKFTDIEGDIYVDFKFKDNNILETSVTDNGIGISEQNQCKLFNIFVQIEESICKNGTGLGLAISKKLSELLGGEIKVESILGEGSTFSFSVKYEPYESFEKSLDKDVELLKDKIVLVVDDNADNRIVLSEMLFEWKMKPIMCASALEALRMVMKDRYNFSLGLIDICMPGTTGSELAREIKEEKPYLPLIALSSIDSFINSNEFEAKIEKPVIKIKLFNAIHSTLTKNTVPDGYIGENKSDPPNSPNYNFYQYSRILIAEDVSYNRNLLVNMLESLKYKNIITSNNGEETINNLDLSYQNNEPIDILLLDLRMPIIDGYYVIEYMKEKNMKDTIIIVVTASVLEDDIQKCKEYGIEYFIKKPINLTQLKNILLHVTNLKLNF